MIDIGSLKVSDLSSGSQWTLHVVPVVGGEVLQGEAEDGEEQVEEVAHAQEQQQHVERPEALLSSVRRKEEGDFEGELHSWAGHLNDVRT